MFRKAIHDFVSRAASLDDLPPAVATTIRQHIAAPDSIEALLTLPPQRYPLWRSSRWRVLPFGWRVTPVRTLAFTPEALVIAETDAVGNVTACVIPLAGVTELELTVNLLYGCLALNWAEAGQVASQRLEFSTVGMHWVRAALDDWRAGIPRPEADGGPGVSLAGLPIKFRNYLRTALLPGEGVRAALFQPEIRRERRWFGSRLAPNRTVGLTDWHVIMLEEDAAPTVANYSLITHYLPWRSVRGLDLAPRPDGLIEATLTLGLGDAHHDQCLLMGRAEAEALRAAFDAVAAGRMADRQPAASSV